MNFINRDFKKKMTLFLIKFNNRLRAKYLVK